MNRRISMKIILLSFALLASISAFAESFQCDVSQAKNDHNNNNNIRYEQPDSFKIIIGNDGDRYVTESNRLIKGADGIGLRLLLRNDDQLEISIVIPGENVYRSFPYKIIASADASLQDGFSLETPKTRLRVNCN